MKMEGTRELAATKQQAWDALNDPEVLKACIPGCDRITATGEGMYDIGMAVKVGPVSAKFTGKIALQDVQPPTSYTLKFEGQGGPAGFGKGTSHVTLEDGAGGGATMRYDVDAQVGGRIAQVGQRLIDGVAKSMAEDFFRRFEGVLVERHPVEAATPDAASAPAEAPTAAAGGGIPVWVWAAIAVVVIAAIAMWKM